MYNLSARSALLAGVLSSGLVALPGVSALGMSYTVFVYPGMSVPVPGEDLVVQQVFPPGFLGGENQSFGDTDDDGDADPGTVFANYTGPLSSTTVLEPASVVLLVSGTAFGLRRRKN